jgi:hypothetical protein
VNIDRGWEKKQVSISMCQHGVAKHMVSAKEHSTQLPVVTAPGVPDKGVGCCRFGQHGTAPAPN